MGGGSPSGRGIVTGATVTPDAEPETMTVSGPSKKLSSSGRNATVTVFSRCPAGIVTAGSPPTTT